MKKLKISDKFMFSHVMRDPALCKEMIERILDMKIGRLVYVEPEKDIDEAADAKGIRLDIYAEGDDDKAYDVECQVADTHVIPLRSRYYQSLMDMAVLGKGQNYSALKESFVIFICLFDLFGKGRHKYTFTRRCIEEPDVELRDGSQIIILNAMSIKDDCSSKLRTFLDYFSGKETATDDFTRRIDNAVENENHGRKWRNRKMTVEQEMMDIERWARQEGRQEALFIAIDSFRDQGLSDREIAEKLKSKYHLDDEEVDKALCMSV